MIFRIAIVEDEQEQTQLLISMLKQFETECNDKFHILSFENPLTFLDEYRAEFDIIFMDIKMPMLNGIDTARRLREKDSDVTLIFVTNMAQYALHGYEVDAVDFIVKPLKYYSFSMKLKKAIRNANRHRKTSVTLNTSEGIFCILISDIIYIEVHGHMLTYHTEDREYTIRNSIRAAESELEAHQFIRCNNCYLVNPFFITSIQDNLVKIGENLLPISRSRKAEFFKKYANYLGRSI